MDGEPMTAMIGGLLEVLLQMVSEMGFQKRSYYTYRR